MLHPAVHERNVITEIELLIQAGQEIKLDRPACAHTHTRAMDLSSCKARKESISSHCNSSFRSEHTFHSRVDHLACFSLDCCKLKTCSLVLVQFHFFVSPALDSLLYFKTLIHQRNFGFYPLKRLSVIIWIVDV